VKVTQSKVRRDRMGHIDLAVPVSHIWYFKSLPSRMGYLLDFSVRELERILYYENYVIIDPGNTSYKEKDIVTEEEYQELVMSGKEFEAGMGAGAIQELLKKVDIEELSISLRAQVKVETSVQRKKDVLKRLRVIEAFRQSNNRPDCRRTCAPWCRWRVAALPPPTSMIFTDA
jgi:DNA-directed RNA polymerase subunit beta'